LDTKRPVDPAPSVDDGLLRAAFREVQGRRLHGFALLVTLGDRALATRLANDALAEGVAHAAALRHPERAASWLRHRVLRRVPRRLRRSPSREERRAILAMLGVSEHAFDALARLSAAERATLIAGGLEGLGEIDLQLILGSRSAATRRRVLEVRRKFLVAHIQSSDGSPSQRVEPEETANGRIGPLAERIRQIAGQALATRSA
jgi:hypothetical protein